MARYIGPRYRQCRRVGVDYNISRTRPYSAKCKSEKTPGQFAAKPGRAASDFAAQLRMKQMIKQIYGVLERQFRSCYYQAKKIAGATGENILKLLESRLDNVVYRMGFAASRREARQLVSHGAILVNGNPIDIPSYRLKANDSVEIRESSKSQLRIRGALEVSVEQNQIPEWVEVDPKNMVGILKYLPSLDDLPPEFKDVNLVVEYYSK